KTPWPTVLGWANVSRPKRNGRRPRAVPMAVATRGETSGTSRRQTAPAIGQGEPSTFRAERTGMRFGSRGRVRRFQRRRASEAKCSPCRSRAFQKVQVPMDSMTWQAMWPNGCRIGITPTTTKRPLSQILRALLAGRSKRCAGGPGSSRQSVFAQAIGTGERWTVVPAARDFGARKTRFSSRSHKHADRYMRVAGKYEGQLRRVHAKMLDQNVGEEVAKLDRRSDISS